MMLAIQNNKDGRSIMLQSLNAATSAPPSPPLGPEEDLNADLTCDLSCFSAVKVDEANKVTSDFAQALFGNSHIINEIEKYLHVTATVSTESLDVEHLDCQAFIWKDTIFMRPPVPMSGSKSWATGEFQRCLIETAEKSSACHHLVVAIDKRSDHADSGDASHLLPSTIFQ
ncbi:hypothetical protein NQZ79_g4173 [Umbelopsis isabellina]|nr:hypothetical protein NQZ79_g4173 [Umbelopsis isabellina]